MQIYCEWDNSGYRVKCKEYKEEEGEGLPETYFCIEVSKEKQELKLIFFDSLYQKEYIFNFLDFEEVGLNENSRQELTDIHNDIPNILREELFNLLQKYLFHDGYVFLNMLYKFKIDESSSFLKLDYTELIIDSFSESIEINLFQRELEPYMDVQINYLSKLPPIN